MAYPIRKLEKSEYPELLSEIPDPPKELFLAGNLPKKENKILCVVGSRKYTSYGREVCETLISGLSGQPITIISGLALGIDSIAHETALKNSLQTVAIPGSGLDVKVLYPSSHLNLANRIVEAGGGLISEFEPHFKATPWSFPQRNRIMAGMSDAVLVIEAEEKSGTLITSRLATEYNRNVLTVPGSIFSASSSGPNMLLKLGATPVSGPNDILDTLNIEISEKNESKKINFEELDEKEKVIINLLSEPRTRDEIIRLSSFSTSEANMILSALEIKGIIKENLGEIRLL